MEELKPFQKELMERLRLMGLSREDIFSVMLVLTNEDKAKTFVLSLEERPGITPDEVFELAGKIAYGEN